MGQVVVVGSLNLDLVVTATRHPTPGETVAGTGYAEYAGGKGLNQAIAAARAGATTSMVGAVGPDAAGSHLRHVASDAGVDLAGVTISEVATGRALIVVDERGENSIVVVPGANGTVEPHIVEPAVLAGADVVLCQLEIPLASVEAALRVARANGAVTVLDPAPAARLAPTLLEQVDIVVPNEHELESLGGLDTLFGLGVQAVIVTMGARGVRCHRPTEAPLDVAAFDVPVVDTTGAGDAFRGALATELAAGVALDDALVVAVAAGALATTVAGAVPSLPRRLAIDELLEGGRRSAVSSH